MFELILNPHNPTEVWKTDGWKRTHILSPDEANGWSVILGHEPFPVTAGFFDLIPAA